MVLAKVCTDSVNETFHCMATSRLRSWVPPWAPALCSASNEITVGLARVLRLLRYSTKSTSPRSKRKVCSIPPPSLWWIEAGPAASTSLSTVSSWTASSTSAAAGRSSRTTISRPLLRKAYSRIRAVIVSREYDVVSKTSGEAQ